MKNNTDENKSGELLEEIKKKYGISYEDMSEATGVPKPTINYHLKQSCPEKMAVVYAQTMINIIIDYRDKYNAADNDLRLLEEAFGSEVLD